MKRWIVLVSIGLLSSVAQAQQPVDGSAYRQDRSYQNRQGSSGVLRHGDQDARRLDELQRMRARSQQRVRELRHPPQSSRPANSIKSYKNTVQTN